MSLTSDVEDRDDKTAQQPESLAYWFPLAPHPVAIEQAHQLSEIALSAWNMRERLGEVQRIAAELVRNALEVGDAVDLTLSRQDGAVLIEVWDTSETPPTVPADGRIPLFKTGSNDWGWRLHDDGGRTVWAIASGPPPCTLSVQLNA
ncbi:hypothetical protein GCM10029978_044020 [Actinoallomurus acanthiterrae]